ncbi:deoxyribose-phosphate aldolase [Zunongwangia sp. F363]|uniref:Deoxyribose-phosphate aldolase n=1 Tax=Autumnicola tepida TaxID=3075595 RepID=A0ABU3C8H4_9FLAO|nr:deoxyribose-phosphate aldolase [Zunongwangia sp. F363]MDT0642648.1 deoxyribose-phosphate aldolase [Zunongwangia sp. F363]
MQLNQYIDHTSLKAVATPGDIIQLCKEAKKHQFYAVCVNGSYVRLAGEALKGSGVKVAAVIGFPLGAMDTRSKIFEARECTASGADEIDMVINIGELKDGNLKFVEDEISEIKKAIGTKVLKVIIETCYLTEDEKIAACKCALNAKADFVKTSTGFGSGGATFEDVKLMKSIVGDKLQVKASGGIKDAETAANYIKLGASRLGTSSGIFIISKS